VTEGPRKVNTNTVSSTPGPRGHLFTITCRQHLEYLQRQRQKAEEELAIQKAILAERKKELAARMELAEVKDQTGSPLNGLGCHLPRLQAILARFPL
jgi:hypothetical protein